MASQLYLGRGELQLSSAGTVSNSPLFLTVTVLVINPQSKVNSKVTVVSSAITSTLLWSFA